MSIGALLTLLVSITFAPVATAHAVDKTHQTNSTIEQKQEFPFFQDGEALISVSGLVSSYAHSFREKTPSFATAQYLLCIKLPFPDIHLSVLHHYFTLHYKSLILYPFHSFW